MEVHDQPDSPYPHLLAKSFTVDFLVYCDQEPTVMPEDVPDSYSPMFKPQGIPFRTTILYMLSVDGGERLMLNIAKGEGDMIL